MSKSLLKKALQICKEDEIIHKQKKSKKSQKSTDNELFLKKGKKSKSLIEAYFQQRNKNYLVSNLEYISKISQPVVKYDDIKMALGDNSTKSEVKPITTKKDIITEEDFRAFEKEYFKK